MPLLKSIALIGLSAVLALSGCALAVVGAGAGAVLHDRRTAGALIDDKGIELQAEQLLTKLRRNYPKLRVIPVSYNNNLVLVGQAPTEFLREKVIQELQQIRSVNKIFDEMSLNDPIPMATRAHDTWVTTQVKSKMLLSKVVDVSRIKVITEDGVVYLLGIVSGREEAEAVRLIKEVSGVIRIVKIFDQL